jgi:hypothetical protein
MREYREGREPTTEARRREMILGGNRAPSVDLANHRVDDKAAKVLAWDEGSHNRLPEMATTFEFGFKHPTQFDAKQMIEPQDGRGSVLFGPVRVDVTRSVQGQCGGAVDSSRLAPSDTSRAHDPKRPSSIHAIFEDAH